MTELRNAATPRNRHRSRGTLRLKTPLNLVAFGMLIAIIDVSVQIDSRTVDLLPDLVGMLLVIAGTTKLRRRHTYFQAASLVALIAGGMLVLATFAASANLFLRISTVLSVAEPVAFALVYAGISKLAFAQRRKQLSVEAAIATYICIIGAILDAFGGLIPRDPVPETDIAPWVVLLLTLAIFVAIVWMPLIIFRAAVHLKPRRIRLAT